MTTQTSGGLNHPGFVVWFTGLSGSGKTTLCRRLEAELRARGCRVEVLDGDEVRQHLCRDLGFSRQDRDENVRRLGFMARLLARHGVIVLVSAISPYRAARAEQRALIGDFVEVYVRAPVEVCEARDVKGLYRRARAGEIPAFTGLSDPYEPPLAPEVECPTHQESVEESLARIMAFLERAYLDRPGRPGL